MATLPANQYSLIQDFDPNNDLATLETVAPGITNIVASQNKPGEQWWQTLERGLTGLAATYYQTEILRVNIDRAKQGLPPITGTDVTATTVAVGLSRDPQNLLLILGGGLLLGLLLLRRR